MRLALPATLFLVLSLLAPASVAPVAAQTFAYAAPHAVRTPSVAPTARAVPRLAARVEVGITAAWPAAAPDFADYAAQEIEAGSVDRDLYVRWYAFSARAEAFAIEVSVDGRPFEVAARVAASPTAGHEYGVHLEGLAPGRYEVRMREDGGTVSAPVRIRVR